MNELRFESLGVSACRSSIKDVLKEKLLLGVPVCQPL